MMTSTRIIHQVLNFRIEKDYDRPSLIIPELASCFE